MNSHFFQQVVEANESIIIKDLTGKILFWNKASENLFGFKSCEVNGKAGFHALPDSIKSEEENFLEKILRGEKIENFSTHRLTKDNKLISISINVSVLFDPDGKISGISF